jgi:hypothetical protein
MVKDLSFFQGRDICFWKGNPDFYSAPLSRFIGITSPMAVQTDPPGPDVQLEKTLIAREHARADAWMRKNRQALDVLLDDRYMEINVLGRFTKKEVLNVLLDGITLHSFSISKPDLLAVAGDVTAVTYRCDETLTIGGIVQDVAAMVTALYTRHGSLWKLLLWQITPLTGCRTGE